MSKCILWQKFWQNNFDKNSDRNQAKHYQIFWYLKEFLGVGTSKFSQKYEIMPKIMNMNYF